MISTLLDEVAELIQIITGQAAYSPWPLAKKWSDDAGGGQTYAQAYHAWVETNISKYYEEMYLCNWFPIRLLVEYAATNGLPVRLKCWPGSAPTDGRERTWDMTKVEDMYSHSGTYRSKLQYYVAVKSKVTARMLGELNSDTVALEDTKIGDLVIIDGGDRYWHAAVVTKNYPNSVATLSGYTPSRIPNSEEGRVTYKRTDLQNRAYGDAPRRWKFAQFD